MGLSVILAEDHVLVRQGLRSLLDREDFAVLGEASNGQEAVRLAAEAARPAAYTADYSWRWEVVKGAGFTLMGPALSIGLAVGTKRYQARALAPRGHGR